MVTTRGVGVGDAPEPRFCPSLSGPRGSQDVGTNLETFGLANRQGAHHQTLAQSRSDPSALNPGPVSLSTTRCDRLTQVDVPLKRSAAAIQHEPNTILL
jgi:hypothetical protein